MEDEVRTPDEIAADEAAEESRAERGVSREQDQAALLEELANIDSVDDESDDSEPEAEKAPSEFDREVDFEKTGDTQFGTVAVEAPGVDSVVSRTVPDVGGKSKKDVVTVVTQVRVAK